MRSTSRANCTIRQYFDFTVANRGIGDACACPRDRCEDTLYSLVRIDVRAPALECRMTVGMMAWKFRAASAARSRSNWR
jgi:hypothetical protein